MACSWWVSTLVDTVDPRHAWMFFVQLSKYSIRWKSIHAWRGSTTYREPVEGGAVSDCGASAPWARGMPRAGWAGRPTPVLPCAQDSAHEQGAAEPTGTYLRRP